MDNTTENIEKPTSKPKSFSPLVLIISLILCGLISLILGIVASVLIVRTNPGLIGLTDIVKNEITVTPEEDGPPTLTPEVIIEDSQPATPSVTTTTTSTDVVEWMTYSNAEYNFTVQYPKGWVIDGPSNEKLFRIFKGGYVLNIKIMEAWGPEVCVYSDTARPLPDALTMVGMYAEYDNFFHIDGNDGLSYRRTLDETGTSYSICSASDFEVGEYMGESVVGQLLSYSVPAGAKDSKMMSLLDQMLVSFKVN